MDIKLMEETFSEISKKLGWAVDKRIALSVTNFYLTQTTGFQAEEHEKASKTIKKSEGWFSPLQAHMHHIAAAFLAISQEDPETGLKALNARQQQLNDGGFSKSAYTYLAALLMQEGDDVKRAKLLYEEMRSHHKFLTSQEDVPYAILLSRQEGAIAERAATMNAYYKDLREQGFTMGNDLQWLSQVMTFNSPVYDPKVVGRVLALKEFFKNEEIKIRASHYPVIGFLAVSEAEGPALMEIVENTKLLKETKLYRWFPDMVFPTVVQYAMKDAEDVRGLSNAAFSTSLEMLMQAQQAAMMVSVNAAISASNNSSN
ncbi:DUF4003 family protein [Planococcus sp. YIM B11945]|uniref:DUF4003 family protein n=1 Tax=Planococcus sp. YIM B11945 TaxID=3435410 RepID=UPI003D7C36F0